MSAQDSNVEEYGILAADGDPERQESRYGRQIQSAGYAGNQICERTVLKMYDVHVCSTFKKRYDILHAFTTYTYMYDEKNPNLIMKYMHE